MTASCLENLSGEFPPVNSLWWISQRKPFPSREFQPNFEVPPDMLLISVLVTFLHILYVPENHFKSSKNVTKIFEKYLLLISFLEFYEQSSVQLKYEEPWGKTLMCGVHCYKAETYMHHHYLKIWF